MLLLCIQLRWEDGIDIDPTGLHGLSSSIIGYYTIDVSYVVGLRSSDKQFQARGP